MHIKQAIYSVTMVCGDGEGRGGGRGGVITPALKGNGIMRSPCVRFTSLYRLSGICFDYTVETHGNFGVAILIIEDNG